MNFKNYLPHLFTKEKTYLVYFYWNKVVIYKKSYGYIRERKIINYKNYYSEIVAEYNPITIFKHDNFALLEIDKQRYVYIDDFIYEFSTYDDIIKLNEDQTFPAAYSDKYLYFLFNMKYLPIENTYSDIPYDVYYRESIGINFYHNRYAKRMNGLCIIK